ncbi:histidine--tRNA ligase [Myxococcota bacterium]
MRFRCVKGMQDILPGPIERWQAIEARFRRMAHLFRYAEVRTPILESTELFVRSIGETTDVVGKEMFTFERSDGSLTLRPENTAGAARAYLEHGLGSLEPVTRWFYVGPMFRAERPQRGRFRQFHQAGCEIFGDPGPHCDAEMIDMLAHWLTELGVPRLEVHVSSLGGPEVRVRHREALLVHLRPRAAELSEHARDRLEQNPFRVLDSKDERDQRVVEGAPSILEMLQGEDRAHWEGLCRALSALGTPYTVNPSLVRGLDYYTRTVFEFRAQAGELGSQNALLGGGRYDELMVGLGGPRVPALGFAVGLERLLLAIPDAPSVLTPFCFVAPLGPRARCEALVLGRDLRARGVVVEMDARGGSLRSMLRRADALGARFCLVLGDSELDRGVIQLKDLQSHTQDEVAHSHVPTVVAERLSVQVSHERRP